MGWVCHLHLGHHVVAVVAKVASHLDHQVYRLRPVVRPAAPPEDRLVVHQKRPVTTHFSICGSRARLQMR